MAVKDYRELQEQVLGMALAYPEAAEQLSFANLPEEVFTQPYREIYQAWRRVQAATSTRGAVVPTAATVLMELGYRGKQKEEAEKRLAEMVQLADQPQTFPYYLDQLVKTFKLHHLHQISAEMARDLRKTDDPHQAIAALYDRLFALESIGRQDWSYASLAEGTDLLLRETRDALQGQQGMRVIPTGFDGLDRLLNGGIAMGTISLWAGRPGMGKSAVLKSIALNIARSGVPVVFFSLEMPMEQCLQRFVAEIAQVETVKLQNPSQLSDEEWHRLEIAADLARDWPLWIEDTPNMTVGQLYNRAKWYAKHKGVKAVFIDYLQLLRLNNGRVPEDEAEWSVLASTIWQMTRELNVAGFYAVQLNREVDKREDKRPRLSDIRNTGRFENDAHYVIGIYRDEYYQRENSDRPNIIDLIILKHRTGDVGEEEMYFDKPFQAVREASISIDEALKSLDAF